ncbi:hypothetical protein MXB_3049 [Myxobolus squamalis]|nr:hypothetical protein MXB_3049 [Myxobolus squamalis]
MLSIFLSKFIACVSDHIINIKADRFAVKHMNGGREAGILYFTKCQSSDI